MFTEIYSAIHDRAVVELSYRGGGTRRVEPRLLHILPHGRGVLYAYQTDGFSRSGLVPGWKSFDVANITRFRRTGDQFEADRPDPTLEEAQDLIEVCLTRGVPDQEVIRVLERAGVPSTWVTERISNWRANNEDKTS